MRVTNSMISNSSQSHILNAKNMLLKGEEQYTSQKKILRPSDDPTVAIRSLQLRTTYSQIQQYVDKNVQDAMDWMDTTESALKNIDSILENMKGYLNQGANDYLAVDERQSVLSVLQNYAAAAFEDEANTDYAGRYAFTGYRTDTSLLFPTKTTNLEYEIKQKFTTEDVDAISYVTGGATYGTGKSAADYAKEVPSQGETYRIQLAYDNCSNTDMTKGATTTDGVKITVGGTALTKVKTIASTDADAYAVSDPDVDAYYLYDTGEIVFSKATYESIQNNQSEIEVTYCKKEFEKSDIRPQMYFECSCYDNVIKPANPTYYAEPSDQSIRYEINFSQTMTVNTQAKDAISTDIYRAIDYIAQTVAAMDELENKISDVEKMITNETDSTKIADYEKLKEMLETEKTLRTSVMTEAFAAGLTMVDEAQEKLNVAVADLGSKYKRLQLTEDKLSDQEVDTEEKLSDNEDIDLADAYINLTQADNLYQASLSATARILGNSLLNYI